MNTALDDLEAVLKRIKEADDSELQQITAFMKGYEKGFKACKAMQTAETDTQVGPADPEASLHS